jgi:hypothetical protein
MTDKELINKMEMENGAVRVNLLPIEIDMIWPVLEEHAWRMEQHCASCNLDYNDTKFLTDQKEAIQRYYDLSARLRKCAE